MMNKRNYVLAKLLVELQTIESLMDETHEVMLAPGALSSSLKPIKEKKKITCETVIPNKAIDKKRVHLCKKNQKVFQIRRE